MENARIFLVEDDGAIRSEAEKILMEAGHEIVLQAADWNEVYDAIPKLKESRVNVGVIDGNLDKHSTQCSDGKIISKRLRKDVKGVKIVAFSASDNDTANYGDLYVEKTYPSWVQELPRAVASL